MLGNILVTSFYGREMFQVLVV